MYLCTFYQMHLQIAQEERVHIAYSHWLHLSVGGGVDGHYCCLTFIRCIFLNVSWHLFSNVSSYILSNASSNCSRREDAYCILTLVTFVSGGRGRRSLLPQIPLTHSRLSRLRSYYSDDSKILTDLQQTLWNKTNSQAFNAIAFVMKRNLVNHWALPLALNAQSNHSLMTLLILLWTCPPHLHQPYRWESFFSGPISPREAPSPRP